MLTINEVALKLNCSAALIYQLCAQGHLAHHRFGVGRGTIRVTEKAVEELLDKTLVEPQSLKSTAGLKHIRLRRERTSA